MSVKIISNDGHELTLQVKVDLCGKIYVPLEMGARIIHGTTPKFAKMVISYLMLNGSKLKFCGSLAHITWKLNRGERIRTSGPCLPKAVLYQAELHPAKDCAV